MRAKNKKIGFRDIIIGIIFATNIAAIILLFSSLLSWKVSPLVTNLFSYIGLGFGFILLLNVCYLIFWILVSRWKLAFVSFVSLLLCYKPVTTFFPLHLFPEKAPEEAIKILTYNVEGFPKERSKKSEEHPILDYIARTDADIVCIQEYLISKTGQSIISQRDVNRILDKYPYQSVTGLESSGKYHIFGLACFSKFPIEKTFEVKFESSYNGAAVYTININGKRYTVANIHLESNNIKAEDKKLYSDFIQNSDSVKLEAITSNIRTRLGGAYRMRAKQVEKIKQYIETQHTNGTIICGDFNDTPISYAYGQMIKGLNDAYVSTAFGPGITYHEDLFLFRIDHIMHSKNIKAFKTKVDKVKFSDHYPLRTSLLLE
jgi:endonuclease/exonuclease/phosphatase family metal-dependent hydrolase